ncbi:Zn(II)2Cys6 transcription factor [Aspergillus saccharolyticus JOP 1030-1]|uniref:Zn(2)-C6 fungal-type domain-containing protein n=1 Tax=Aspergillus saccharolyticus JOP 1030-1 TaxID=1450539 RepID=A0A318ZEZ0_9EURO|nr:hypothetical protein BP01DRAFT_415557 [Aspergillus saccharolyticus JOP 1030-1]PYH45665.1 hypothetical protein BP01DRAFT_415557 [Aspergillus saccharolyticus JOP 1030-1]
MSPLKRKHDAVPHTMVQRWTSQPRLSCQNCRQKKWRCDRKHPCNNCKLRKTHCQYLSGTESQALSIEPGRYDPVSNSPAAATNTPLATSHAESITVSSPQSNTNESTGLLDRIRRLEEALSLSSVRKHIDEFDDCMQDPKCIFECLPPIEQARLLFDRFVRAIQPSLGILHIPSVRVLMEETYRDTSEGKEPNFTVLILLLAIYAGGTIVATPELLESLEATEEKSRTAFATFMRLAITMLDHPKRPIAPSTVALLAITILSHILTHADGFHDNIQALRMRAIFMARVEERKRTQYEVVEIEVQRRIWWHIVASDWIVSLTQGPQEGSYLLHPNHMRVNYPSNIDDETLATSALDYSLPLSTPTSMSVFILRVHFADVCRQIVDAFASMYLGDSELPDYEVVLDLDRKLHNVLESMPYFLRLDPESVQRSRGIIKERPYLAWQRTVGHLGVYARICRLHRPYHREASINSKFAYSRQTCLRFAQHILDLRRTLDEAGSSVSLKPSNYWMVMQHVFLAAMVLATDVSMNPRSPGAQSRKQEVLEACKMLEQSQRLSTRLTEAIQRNTQTLLSILQSTQKEQPPPSQAHTGVMAHAVPTHPANADNTCLGSISQRDMSRRVSAAGASEQQPHSPNNHMSTGNDSMAWDGASTNPPGEESWGQLWSDLFTVAPAIDDIHWDLLLNDWDMSINSGF